MTSRELEQIEAQMKQLKPKARKLFLEGKITLVEAQQFSVRSRTENQRLSMRVEQLHKKRHEDLLREHEGVPSEHDEIAAVYTSVDKLVYALFLLPAHITKSVISGQITLVQARYASHHKMGRKKLTALHCVNKPTVPHREIKHKLGTEHSLRDPVRVRPRSRHAHPANR